MYYGEKYILSALEMACFLIFFYLMTKSLQSPGFFLFIFHMLGRSYNSDLHVFFNGCVCVHAL